MRLLFGLIILMLTLSLDLNAQPPRKARKKPPPRRVVVKRTPRHKVVYVHPRRPRRVVKVVPAGAAVIHHRNVKYHYHGGIYYRLHKGQYIVVPPARGLRVRVLPPSHVRIVVGPGAVFYCAGIFYNLLEGTEDEYEVIEPPVGAVVQELPEDAEEVMVDGESYYEYDGALYKKVSTDDGEGYEVAELIEEEE